jgi:hypothetical protein
MDNVDEMIELWMKDHTACLRGTVKSEQVGESTILTPNLQHDSIAKRQSATDAWN